MPDVAAINGVITPLAEAHISVLDLGFLRGIGAFESLRTYAGQPYALAEHHARLSATCATLAIDTPWTATELRAQIAALVDAAGGGSLRVNLIVTPGNLSAGVFGSQGPATVVMLAKPIPAPDPSVARDGIRAVTFAGQRALPEAKTTAYLTGRRGLAEATAAGAAEALYCDEQDLVSEGVTSNLCARFGDRVVAPERDTLPGVTRDALRHLAENHGLEWSSEDLPRTRLLAADEVWICSSIRELAPVVMIDQHPIATGRPGAWFARLAPALHQHCHDHAQLDAKQYPVT